MFVFLCFVMIEIFFVLCFKFFNSAILFAAVSTYPPSEQNLENALHVLKNCREIINKTDDKMGLYTPQKIIDKRHFPRKI